MRMSSSSARAQRVIVLSPAESFAIYGFRPQRTVNWAQVEKTPHITIDLLMSTGMDHERVRQLQPSLAAWYAAKKATLLNLATMDSWRINIPVECPRMTLIDCIELARYAPAARFKAMGLDLHVLQSQYGMELKQMAMFPYDMSGWLLLGFTWEMHAGVMDASVFCMVFKMSMAHGWNVYNHLIENK